MPKDFPRGTEEMWDVVGKAMLLRALGPPGNMVHISTAELEAASQTACEIEMLADGSLVFRLEGGRKN